mgnify:CR=1 FL=1
MKDTIRSKKKRWISKDEEKFQRYKETIPQTISMLAKAIETLGVSKDVVGEGVINLWIFGDTFIRNFPHVFDMAKDQISIARANN